MISRCTNRFLRTPTSNGCAVESNAWRSNVIILEFGAICWQLQFDSVVPCQRLYTTSADQCTERLGIDSPLELYAYASPQFNAACFKPEEGRVFIMFSSSLLEAFSDTELLFVMGHELGHHVYQHHDLPIGYILRGPEPIPPDTGIRSFHLVPLRRSIR